jgi:outer membrane protein OmpA-like peptidoglycan-associated protein
VGLRYFARKDFVFHSGIGVGDFSGIGSGDFRFSLGLKFSPVENDPVPAEPRPAPSVAPKPKRVVFTPKEIRISEEVKFEHNKDVLTQSGRDLLDEVAQVIKANLRNFKKIRIEGHANELGTDEYNLDLSRRRSIAVREYLASRGVASGLLLTAGYGERRPKPESRFLSREAALNMNRRVEFRVLNAREAASAAVQRN